MKYSKARNKKTMYTITKLPGSGRKALLCPDCGEKLIKEDLEQYSACPYCGKKLSFNIEMEDFLLLPFADPWDISGNEVLPNTFFPDDDALK